jgi:hypothetical protein
MTEVTSGGGRLPPLSIPAEFTGAVTPRGASRADSMAWAMTDRQALAVQRKRIAGTANIQSLTVIARVLFALVSYRAKSGGTEDG